jgi:ribosomal protein S18 acetylase RimI-like enzyme
VTPPFAIRALADTDERAAYTCGSQPLDRYFHQQVTQDIGRRIAACFVAVEIATDRVAGFYTLATSSIPLPDLPHQIARKLPRYPLVPAVCLGRLAVDSTFKRRGLGSALLFDALARSLRSEIIAYAMVVDAKDEAAAAFYRHHEFIAFEGHSLKLFLPLVTAKKLL